MSKNLIVNFHVINDSGWFEKVLVLLKSKYKMTDMSYFEVSNHSDNRNFCHLTFDDGERSFYTIVYPLLKKYNIPATVFISPRITVNRSNFWFQEVKGYDENIMKRIIADNLALRPEDLKTYTLANLLKSLTIDQINKVIHNYQLETNTPVKGPQNMSLKEVLELDQDQLVTFGAHTLNHPILANESNERCKKEIIQSITDLEELLGHDVKYFAYPNGFLHLDFGEREKEVLSRSNISIAVTLEGGFVSENDDRLFLPRIGLTYGSIRFVKLKLLLGKKWEILKSIRGQSDSNKRLRLS